MIEKAKDKLYSLADEYQYRYDYLQRIIFNYGYNRTEELVKALRTHPKYYTIRINSLQTTNNKLLNALIKKDIPVIQHPSLDDTILVEVKENPKFDMKEKTVVAHKGGALSVLRGSNLGAASIMVFNEINIGDEVSVVDKFGTLIGNGIAMMNTNHFKNNQKGVAIKITDSLYNIPNLENQTEYLRGYFIEHDLPSILIGAQVNLKKNDRVLDMIVGAGEIITHIWQRNNDKTPRIIAIDNSKTRLNVFSENIKRLKMNKAPFETMLFDSRKLDRKFTRDETFDWIIINPPCTDSGYRPKLFDTNTEPKALRLINNQRRLLKQAARLIKRNGTIFYITKSIDPGENEENIKFAVEELKLNVAKQEIFIGDNCSASFNGSDLLQYFYPDKQETSGYFIAKLTK